VVLLLCHQQQVELTHVNRLLRWTSPQHKIDIRRRCPLLGGDPRSTRLFRDLLAAFIARRTAVRKHVRLELTKLYRADFEAKSNPVTVDAARVRLEVASIIPTILRQPSGPGGAIASRASTQSTTPSTDKAACPLYIAALEGQSDEESELTRTMRPKPQKYLH